MGADRGALTRSDRLREWPFAVVVATALVGLFVVAELDRFRRGSVVFAAAFALAAVLRLVLPTRVVGLLKVRGRVFDIVVYAVLAAGIAALAIAVPADVPGG
jgi:hypothetical protein